MAEKNGGAKAPPLVVRSTYGATQAQPDGLHNGATLGQSDPARHATQAPLVRSHNGVGAAHSKSSSHWTHRPLALLQV